MLDIEPYFQYNGIVIGVWRSLVSRLVRVQEASGSNPDTPTITGHPLYQNWCPVYFLQGGKLHDRVNCKSINEG